MERLLERLAWNDRLSQEEQDGLLASVSRIQPFAQGETIVPAEARVDFSSIILQGMSCRQKVLNDGQRQITAFHLAGDFAILIPTCSSHFRIASSL